MSGEVADCAKVKDKVSIQERDTLIVVAQDRRKKLIERGLTHDVELTQPSCPPHLSIGLVAEMLFFYDDDNAGCTTGGWSAGAITRISNGKNLRNNNGSYF